jgi:hypothetical protein
MDKKQIIAYLNFLRDDLTNKDEIIDYCINKIKEEIECDEKDNWVKVYKDEDLPKESSLYWIRQSDGLIQTMKEYEENKKYWIVNATHYQPIIKPNAPTI